VDKIPHFSGADYRVVPSKVYL